MSGLGIPTYVVDSPHGGGKIPMMPNYLVSMSDDAVVLRNYEGLLIRYQAEDKPTTNKPTKTRGVSALLQGSTTALVPEDTERMIRRRQQLHVIEPADHNHNGCCGGNGHSNGTAYAADDSDYKIPQAESRDGRRMELLVLNGSGEAHHG
jgi:lysine 2,3-aminomutase